MQEVLGHFQCGDAPVQLVGFVCRTAVDQGDSELGQKKAFESRDLWRAGGIGGQLL